MLPVAQAFIDALNKAELKHKGVQDLEGDATLVIVGVNGKNTRYDVLFIFDPNGETASIRVPRLVAGCPEEKTFPMLDAINEINAKFRWLKLYLDKDQNIDAQADAYVNDSVESSVCVKLLLRIVNIIDECYPMLMHALWA